MLIFLSKKEAQKKRYSKFRVILSSYSTNVNDFIQEKIFPMEQLIPPTELMQEYLNNQITKKVFRKKYFDHLQQDNYRITLSYIIFDIVKNNQDYIMTCSDEEYEYGYMSFLSEFIHKLYGLNVLTHKAYKELNLDDKKTILHLNSVPEEVFDFIIEDVRHGYDEISKKKKKKKKDKGKKKKNKDKKKKKNKEKSEFDKDKLKEYGYNSRGLVNDGISDDEGKPIPRKIFKRIDG